METGIIVGVVAHMIAALLQLRIRTGARVLRRPRH